MKIKKLLIAAILPFSALAQWTSDSAINTSVCTASGDQDDVRIASDGTGGAIITWVDSRPVGNSDIYAQRLDSAGNAKWATDGVAICIEASNQTVPNIVEDGNSGAIIVWKDLRNGNSDIYAQKINSSGVVQWTAEGVAVDTKPGEQIDPKIISDGSGGAIIIWQDMANGNWDIIAQRINSSGMKVWSGGGVAVCTALNDQINPRIEEDGLGNAIIVWQDKRNGNDYDIYAQKLNSNGVPQWAAGGVAVCSAADTQNNPKIENDGNGGAIIGWTDKRSGSHYDIYSQRLNSSGVAQWVSNGKAVCSETGNQSAIDFSTKNINGAVFTWKDYRSNIYADIYAQYIDLSGNALWAINGIPITTKLFDQLNPNIITDTSGAIIVWQDSSNGQWDVYGQKILLNGNIQWETNGKIISNADSNQISPKHISDGKGGAIVAWHDKRGTKYDIYVQNVNSDGSLGTVGITERQNSNLLFRIYPNPSNDGKFHISISGNQISHFRIYNIPGEEIFYSVEFPSSINLSSHPKGIYFYQLSSGEKFQTGKIIVK